ncbi:hypothetical protein HMI54_002009 [Coelomomyces lativittatus]|nr:hypothetical protein HMI56_001101 [Coelomomyces lativittatus]KAJ1508240.1 hypothetical protein HMI55_000447 [Coelomomyces lativittatus]KAJ1509944.1 hypothetical protein HMI54_002009 [Coelomomyces lativittatus]
MTIIKPFQPIIHPKKTPSSPSHPQLSSTTPSGFVAKLPSNPLLVKCSVGKPRATCYRLPPESHIYGKKADMHSENANFQLWSTHAKVKTSNSARLLDYISMNKYCLREKILDPKLQSQARRSHPIHVRMATHTTTLRVPRPLPSDTDPYFTYGQPTRPSSPVSKVITGYFMHHLDDTPPRRPSRHLKKHVKLPPCVPPHPPHASPPGIRHPQKQPPQDPSTYFKMPRFRNIPARIVSHWEPKIV